MPGDNPKLGVAIRTAGFLGGWKGAAGIKVPNLACNLSIISGSIEICNTFDAALAGQQVGKQRFMILAERRNDSEAGNHDSAFVGIDRHKNQKGQPAKYLSRSCPEIQDRLLLADFFDVFDDITDALKLF